MVKAKRNIEIIKHLDRFLTFLSFLKDPKPNVQGFSTSTSWLYIISHAPPPPPPPLIVYHPILGISLNNFMEKVERIQYEAELAFTGAWQGSSCVKLYEELGWE